MQQVATSSSKPGVRPVVWGVILLSVFGLSVLGLLQIRLSPYDDSALLLGGRLIGKGLLPYIGFHTPYGPLSYSVVSAARAVSRNPGLELRVLQAALLAVSIGLLLLMSREGAKRTPNPFGLGGVAFAAFLMTNAFCTPAFLGIAFCIAAVAMACLSRIHGANTSGYLAAGGAGLALAGAALVRPAFAAYTAFGILAVEARFRASDWRESGGSRRSLVFAASTVLSLAILWLVLWPRLSPVTAFEATVLVPGRLFVGGARFLSPGQILRPGSTDPGPWSGPLIAGIVAATLMSWGCASRRASARVLVAAAGITGCLGTARLQNTPRPGVEVTILAGVLISIGLAAAFSMRREIQESPFLAAGAAFGLTSVGFGHYFWTRADAVHLPAPLAFAGAAAALAWRPAGHGSRTVMAALFVVLTLAAPQLPQRVLRLASAGRPMWRAPFPAASVPADAVRAVRFADEQSEPGSRFVAVASTQAVTSGNPVLLFLLSARDPYTKWYTYEPGIQSSSEIQAQMAEELRGSGSRAAVVWETQRYLYEPSFTDLSRRTGFDELFDRLYPVRAARFGEYEVRLRGK